MNICWSYGTLQIMRDILSNRKVCVERGEDMSKFRKFTKIMDRAMKQLDDLIGKIVGNMIKSHRKAERLL